jgi:hypothetical protein
MCIFSQHNIIKDAPFSRLDLISCRNLLIYLNADLQNRVIPLFHFALRPGGILFLGNAENVTRYLPPSTAASASSGSLRAWCGPYRTFRCRRLRIGAPWRRPAARHACRQGMRRH